MFSKYSQVRFIAFSNYLPVHIFAILLSFAEINTCENNTCENNNYVISNYCEALLLQWRPTTHWDKMTAPTDTAGLTPRLTCGTVVLQ